MYISCTGIEIIVSLLPLFSLLCTDRDSITTGKSGNRVSSSRVCKGTQQFVWLMAVYCWISMLRLSGNKTVVFYIWLTNQVLKIIINFIHYKLFYKTAIFFQYFMSILYYWSHVSLISHHINYEAHKARKTPSLHQYFVKRAHLRPLFQTSPLFCLKKLFGGF